ncbi:hypothetical protein AURDEDRAFT_17513, partial [Auricularia subglabra TFB-10046 SS5]
MHHIIFECPDHRQAIIWGFVRNFLQHKAMEEHVPRNLGMVWGCALATPSVADGRSKAVERAYRKVVSESAFLIWKLRCEKRVGHKDDPEWVLPPKAIKERWAAMMRRMVSQDY